jgi:hypothetical protein
MRNGGRPAGSSAGLCQLAIIVESVSAHALGFRVARNFFPVVRFERYCDDAVLQCFGQRQAKFIRQVVGELAEIASAFPECSLIGDMAKCRLVRRWEPCDGRLPSTVLI